MQIPNIQVLIVAGLKAISLVRDEPGDRPTKTLDNLFFVTPLTDYANRK
ncbi:MAG: hypothetical protein RM338_32905 [Nostoc sp. DedQUE12a]|nr:hypothetical protein [Nostoc sp. DedQUE12a]